MSPKPGVTPGAAPQRAPANQLLRCLPEKERAALMDGCKRIDLRAGDKIQTARRPVAAVHFPLEGVVVRELRMRGHAGMRFDIVGNEGMVGAIESLEGAVARSELVVALPGSALRLAAATFRQALERSARLRRAINGYVALRDWQLAQAVACNRFHVIDKRLATCLLTMVDRVEGDVVEQTQANLAAALGVRRSGVTVSALELHRRGLIGYVRGRITILDRRGLQAAACDCYRSTRSEYKRFYSQACD